MLRVTSRLNYDEPCFWRERESLRNCLTVSNFKLKDDPFLWRQFTRWWLSSCLGTIDFNPARLHKNASSSYTHEVCAVAVNGEQSFALLDNQASCNFMSLDFAILNNLPIKRFRGSFLLADGSIGYSIGVVRLNCAISAPRPTGYSSEFLVLPACAVPLVLGRRYLFDAGLLSVLRETADVAGTSVETTTPLNTSTSCIKVRLRNTEDSIEVLALPDKGSNRNFMSLALAQSLDSATFIEHQEDILLGNAEMFKTCGVIEASIIFNGNSRRLGWIRMRFVVVETLLFHLMLGNSAIERFRILGENPAMFDWLHLRDEHIQFCMVRIGRKSALDKKHAALVPDPPDPNTNLGVPQNRVTDDERLKYMEKQLRNAKQKIRDCENTHRKSPSLENTRALLDAQAEKKRWTDNIDSAKSMSTPVTPLMTPASSIRGIRPHYR